MERNRAPFDLLEGERELIRGFNIEIGRLGFVYIFLREYGMLIALSVILAAVLSGGVLLRSMVFVSILLYIRRCFPRVR
jgi:NADH-quinone oxidoreductase subunit H